MAIPPVKMHRRCYISSPVLLNTEPLRNLLREMLVDVGDVEEIPPAGEVSVSQLERQIRAASFICGVISTKIGSGSVLFEIGVAVGLGKPVFLIAEDKSDLPVTVRTLPFVETSIADTDTIRFHLEIFVANLELPRKTSSVKESPRFYGGGESYPIASREQINTLPSTEGRVAVAFERAGASVTLSPRFGNDAEADMIAWLPDLDIGIGLPTLVEVRSSAREQFPPRAMDLIRKLLVRSHLKSAIIVTNAPDDDIVGRMFGSGYVFSISINGLENLAQTGQFVSGLKRARNRLAHGLD
ncbi:hypothetical protein [Bradyrhizobium sp. S69]|uniref:hypothetical protein n=1 Tax=Bradyrhizobium sp. S69 TaxID=1641856 RepID=UPI00131D8584|nr:hypothetical protein [Bradyrhizobium sp. S69]